MDLGQCGLGTRWPLGSPKDVGSAGGDWIILVGTGWLWDRVALEVPQGYGYHQL